MKTVNDFFFNTRLEASRRSGNDKKGTGISSKVPNPIETVNHAIIISVPVHSIIVQRIINSNHAIVIGVPVYNIIVRRIIVVVIVSSIIESSSSQSIIIVLIVITIGRQRT